MNRNLSPGEMRLLRLLPTNGKKVTTDKLVERFYRDKEMPEYGRLVIGGLIRSLVKKTQMASLKVRKTDRRGPRPIEVWIEQR